MQVGRGKGVWNGRYQEIKAGGAQLPQGTGGGQYLISLIHPYGRGGMGVVKYNVMMTGRLKL